MTNDSFRRKNMHSKSVLKYISHLILKNVTEELN